MALLAEAAVSDRVAFLRVRSSRVPYRRGGIEFGALPLVLGPEHFELGVDGLRQLALVVTDPVLKVQISDQDDPDKFRVVPDEMIEALRGAIADIDLAEEKASFNDAAELIIARILGERPIADMELQSPEGPEDDDADTAGSDAGEPEPAPETEGKAEAGVNAAPAVDTTPASDASAASGEQSGAGADTTEAPAADASEQNQPEATQQPPVAETQPTKGAAVPVETLPSPVAKPRGSSGRKPAAASTKAAKG